MGFRRRIVTPARVLAVLLLASAGAGGADRARSPLLDAAAQLLREGDLPRARAAYRELAEAGDPLAQQAMARILLDALGGAADRRGAMHWLCRLAHHRDGGPDVVRAQWYLAEYFRTGGGLPGQRYNDGERAAEDPVKAYFWFGIMAAQQRHYAQVEASAVTLGQVGMSQVGRQLHEGERQQVLRALERWAPGEPPRADGDCLDLPRL
jgi:TPR repeat protein